jgi:hypothetical protein
VFGAAAAVIVVGLVAFVARSGGGDKQGVRAAGNASQSSFSGALSTTTTAITVPDASTPTSLASDSLSPSTLTTPTTRTVATTLPPDTQPPTTAPPTTPPAGVPAGYARIEIVNTLDRTVVVHVDGVGAIDATLGAGQSRGASNMEVTDSHGDSGKVNPPGEQCGSGGVGNYFFEQHRYRVTVKRWDGSGDGGYCAAEPTPMLVVTDLDTGGTKTIT